MDEESAATRTRRIRLAEEPEFEIGRLRVRPSLRLVLLGETEIRLEPRVMQVLVALARADGGTVSRDALVEACWDGVVVGDDAVNRVIGRLRRLAEGASNAFRIETIPRIGFRLLPAADENLTDAAAPPREAALAEASEGPKARGGLVRVRTVAAVTLLAIVTMGAFAGIRALGQPTERVAVLPFVGGDEAAGDDFPARLAARIRQVMSLNDLKTVARPSEAAFRGGDLAEAARRQAVAYVLDGDARAEGGAIVVHAELIDARNNLTLWSGEYRRERSERDFMLDQVATHAAYVLRCALVSRRTRSGPQDPQTLSVFLKACDRIHLYDGGRNEALQSARDVTERAPNFSRGWSMLAAAAAVASHYSPPEEAERLRAESRAAIDRALRLDRRNAEAYLAQAALLPHSGRWREQEELIARALRIDPNFADAHAMQGAIYLFVGRMKDAVAAYERAAAADPLSPMNQSNLVPALAGLGRQEQAAALRDRLYRVWPNSPTVWMHRLHNAAFAGKPEDAAAVLEGIDSAPVKMEADTAEAFRRFLEAKVSGSPEAKRRAAERYVDLALQGRFDMAPAIAAMSEIGDLDKAFALARAYLQEPTSISWVLFSPPAENLRRDPRLIALAREIGLVDYWMDTGAWPDFCASPDLSYDCREEAKGLGDAAS